MHSSRIIPKVVILLGVVILFLVIAYQGQIKDFLGFNFSKAGITVDNALNPSGLEPERSRSASLIKKETELKLYIGEPFKSFGQSDWNEFWNIIYGGFPKGKPEQPGLPQRVRQLTENEIQAELVSRYPQPFGYFRDSHWEFFFKLISSR